MMQIIQTTHDLQTHTLSYVSPCHTVTQWHDVLSRWAHRLYGKEGTDWRIVQDTTVIGFHVRALHTSDGETLELR